MLPSRKFVSTHNSSRNFQISIHELLSLFCIGSQDFLCSFKAAGELLSTVVPHCAPAFRRLKLEDLMFGLSLVCKIGKDSVSKERKKAAEELCTVGLPNRSCICYTWVGEARWFAWPALQEYIYILIFPSVSIFCSTESTLPWWEGLSQYNPQESLLCFHHVDSRVGGLSSGY